MTLFSQLRYIVGGWRVGRIIMFTLVTGSVTYGLGGSWVNVVLAGLIGATLSGGGFYLDYLSDYEKDRASGKLVNPIAKGTVSPRAGLSIVVICLATSAVLGFLVNPWLLLPLVSVVFVVGGLGMGVLDTPLLRAFSLGALQGFYVLIGALAANRFELGVFVLALFLFFAMTGGRVLGDMRDLLYDRKTDTLTIPRKYGIRWASSFLLVNEIISYVVGLSVYATGLLGSGYLYCVIGIIIVGLPLSLIFIYRPSPKMGNITNMLSLSILATLFISGMILGKI